LGRAAGPEDGPRARHRRGKGSWVVEDAGQGWQECQKAAEARSEGICCPTMSAARIVRCKIFS